MPSKIIRRVSLIGAGSVGTALAVRLAESGYTIASVISRTRSSARRCAGLVRCARFSNRLTDLAPADLYLLAVPDARLSDVARAMADSRYLPLASSIAAHTSGSFTSDVLSPIRVRNARVCSLHPLQSFPRSSSVTDRVRALDGITYSFEGDDSARAPMRALVRTLGGRMIIVPKEEKILYHIACVVASNYLVAMLGAAEVLFPGSSKKAARMHLTRLVESSVAHALQTSPDEALTGPISRGDVELVRRHVAELKKRRRDFLQLYRVLGLQSLRLAARHLPRSVVASLRRILEDAG